jgi:hypothetical protein
LLSWEKAPSAVICDARLAAVVNWLPAIAALYWPMSAARTPNATGVLKQVVGVTLGCRMDGAAAAKLLASRQLA